jgi:hypothetical protein
VVASNFDSKTQAPCICGCGRTASRGPNGEPPHHARKALRYIEADRGYATPCHVWQLAVIKNGYGLERIAGGQMQYAHRLAYERSKGAIPTGKQVDHLCRVRACVNPEHLELVSQRENIRRGRGTKLTVEAVRRIKRSKEPSKALAERFGVSASHIAQIRNGKAWADVDV